MMRCENEEKYKENLQKQLNLLFLEVNYYHITFENTNNMNKLKEQCDSLKGVYKEPNEEIRKRDVKFICSKKLKTDELFDEIQKIRTLLKKEKLS